MEMASRMAATQADGPLVMARVLEGSNLRSGGSGWFERFDMGFYRKLRTSEFETAG
jgi:hypothetical protein